LYHSHIQFINYSLHIVDLFHIPCHDISIEITSFVTRTNTHLLQYHVSCLVVHSIEELLFFVGAELDAFHAKEFDEEPDVQRDEEENFMLEGIYNAFWNEGRTDDDADF
jgi:hypothetical protein